MNDEEVPVSESVSELLIEQADRIHNRGRYRRRAGETMTFAELEHVANELRNDVALRS